MDINGQVRCTRLYKLRYVFIDANMIIVVCHCFRQHGPEGLSIHAPGYAQVINWRRCFLVSFFFNSIKAVRHLNPVSSLSQIAEGKRLPFVRTKVKRTQVQRRLSGTHVSMGKLISKGVGQALGIKTRS